MTNNPTEPEENLFDASTLEQLLANNGAGFEDLLGGRLPGRAADPLDDLHTAMRDNQGVVRALRGGPRRIRTMNLSDEAYAALKQLALQRGLVWGGSGNVSELLELIGAGVFTVSS